MTRNSHGGAIGPDKNRKSDDEWESFKAILLLIKKGHKRLNMATGTSNDDHATGREKSNRASEECVSGGVAGECRCGWQTEAGKADKRFFHSSVFVEAVTSN